VIDGSDPDLLTEQAVDDTFGADDTEDYDNVVRPRPVLIIARLLCRPALAQWIIFLDRAGKYLCRALGHSHHLDRASAAHSSTSLESFTLISSRRAALDANCAVCCTENGGVHEAMRSVCSFCRAPLSASSACQRRA
jgi:hypothetical protein